ncbi:Translation initiation factor IF-2 [compost metagenome]
MKGMLDPVYKETVIGHAEVRNTFKISKVGTIAGCMVTSGKITRSAEMRLVRDGIVVFEGKIDSLKRFKDDAKEVAQGYECGITLDNYNDLKEGDVIEAFIMEKVEPK